MKSLAKGGYTAAEIRAALLSNRTLDFRYARYDKNNIYLGDFPNVISGSVDHSSLADIKRTAKFNILDTDSVDWLNDRIKPYFRLKMPNGWVEWPLGLFMLSSPTVKAANTIRQTRDIDAYDQTFILLSDKITTRYTVAAGTVVTTEILGLLAGAGITLANVVRSDIVTPTARDWDPGTSKLVVLNGLLDSINYQAVWFDSDGYAQCVPYVSPGQAPTGETYLDDSQSIIFPEATHSLDLFEVPNKWVAYVSDPERASIRSEYTNTAADSPTSTVSRGFTSVDYREVNDITTQATLDAYVARIAMEASQVYAKADLPTGLMPHHEHRDIINVRYTKLGIANRYEEVGWAMDLRPGSKMKHSLRRIVSV